VLSLAPLKCLALNARVVSSEPHPQPLSTEPSPSRAEEEEPAVVAAAEESIAPPPPVPAVAVEEGQTAAEAAAPQAILDPPAEAGSRGGDAVMILDEDSAPPPSSGSHDVVMTPASEPTLAAAVADPSPTVEALEPSLAVETLEPSPAAGAVGTSSAARSVTVEEVLELATSRYIDFPEVRIIDLEAPQLPEKVLEVAMERMFAEPSIMDTIALVLKACHTRFSEESRMHLICVPGSQFHTYDRLMSVISQDIAQNVQKRFINFYYTHEGRHEGLYTNSDNYEEVTPSSFSTGF
jgi:hypothetical protein